MQGDRDRCDGYNLLYSATHQLSHLSQSIRRPGRGGGAGVPVRGEGDGTAGGDVGA